jgi:polygalacturonase
LIAAGSDSIAVKSGYNADGRRVAIPSEDVVITNCNLNCSGGAGISIGSETAGGIRNVSISNCTIAGSKYGIQIRSPRGRGGVVERIHISNLVVDQAREMGVKLSTFFDSVRFEDFRKTPIRRNLEIARSKRCPVDEGTPTIRDVVISSMTLGRTPAVAVVEGLPERFISNVQFRGVDALDAKQGIYLTQTEDVRVLDLSVGPIESPAVDAREVHRLEVRGLRCGHWDPNVPLVWLDTVEGAFVHECYVAGDSVGQSWIRQADSPGVTLAGNIAPPTGP